MTKQIPLTQGKFTTVSDEDFDFLMQNKWFFNCEYAVRKGSRVGGKKDSKIWMHRIVNKTPRGMETDHINGNKLDNRRENLRSVTTGQNQRNSPSRRGTSAYKGVSWNKANKKWIASITIKRKQIHLGAFTSETEAALCYNIAAEKFHGSFARLNQVQS